MNSFQIDRHGRLAAHVLAIPKSEGDLSPAELRAGLLAFVEKFPECISRDPNVRREALATMTRAYDRRIQQETAKRN